MGRSMAGCGQNSTTSMSRQCLQQVAPKALCWPRAQTLGRQSHPLDQSPATCNLIISLVPTVFQTWSPDCHVLHGNKDCKRNVRLCSEFKKR
jgi:hypothetical protein